MPAPPTPVAGVLRRPSRSRGRVRRAARRPVPIAVALVLLLVLAGCGGGGDDDDDDAAPPSTSATTDDETGDTTTPTTADATTTSTAPPPVVTLQVVSAGALSPYGDATLDPAVADAIVAVATAYVQRATADPLYSGAAPVGLDQLFEPAALVPATGADAAAVLDRSTAAAPSGVAVEMAQCAVSVLVGLMGVPQLATVDVHVVLSATTSAGVVRVERTGALTLAPATDGTWRIQGYDLVVDREGPGVTDASAATGATGPAEPATTAAGEAG